MSAIGIFNGQTRNSFDDSCHDGIRANTCTLSKEQISQNIQDAARQNGINEPTANLSEDADACIEMETGTGKTLVYLKTIFELYKTYGFTKFIILVPSVAIKEGVLQSFRTFESQLETTYGFKPSCFEYDSSKLSRVKSFIEEQHPQIMVMTIQSFNSEDRILNQAEREDLFHNTPYIEALAKTRPLIFMDEPQEGMDTENSINQISRLNPLFKLRYSATHKVLKNLVYRLTPFESYRNNLVKKIEVLSVTEKNDEASLKIELSEVKTFKDGKTPQVKLRTWRGKADGSFEFKDTPFMKEGESLEDRTSNISYRGFVIKRIHKPLRETKFHVEFANGTTIVEKEQSKNYRSIFGEQIKWLIDTHFLKKKKLSPLGIKCLSLVFIDRVDNYIREDGIIRKLFENKYREYMKQASGKDLTPEEITSVQGYYFAKTGRGEYTDNESSMRNNKELFDWILRDKETLLSLDNPVEFIFSHSALGVGWDNPNVFNIATLNQSYSEIKKRQEIGRGLRICVNQNGERIYDHSDTKEGSEINLLTVIPNETYETFVLQYQSEIEEIYGTTSAGAATRQNQKGKKVSEKRIKRNEKVFSGRSFREFWRRLSQKTQYLVSFDDDSLCERATKELNSITIDQAEILITLNRIKELKSPFGSTQNLGSETAKMRASFAPLDIIEEISENTALSYSTLFRIFHGLRNHGEIIKNPVKFVQKASLAIKNIELDEMLRGLKYTVNGEKFNLADFEDYITTFADTLQDTPNRGLYEKIIYDSEYERDFAGRVDNDPDIVCFLKLPRFYKIPIPGMTDGYSPDFGVVIRSKKGIRTTSEEELYFVIEIKGTDNIDDKKALTENEIFKIKCAVKHFEALGIDAKIDYRGPVKEYKSFKDKVSG